MVQLSGRVLFSLNRNCSASISKTHNVGPPLTSKGRRSVLLGNGHLVASLILSVENFLGSLGTQTTFLAASQCFKLLQTSVTIGLIWIVVVLLSTKEVPLNILETLVGDFVHFVILVETILNFLGCVVVMRSDQPHDDTAVESNRRTRAR